MVRHKIERFLRRISLHTELSVGHLIFNASVIVQAIMLILFIMLTITIKISVNRWVHFKRIEYKTKQFNQTFWDHATDLQMLYEYYKNRSSEGIERIFMKGFDEFIHSHASGITNPDVIVQNCRRAIEAEIMSIGDEHEKNLSVLATFASSAPYIGLLGTVYGIMTSFIALGGVQQSSIASVAPGIAEALIATAIGLCAAIPSVLSYNFFIAKSERLQMEYEAFIEKFSNLLHRQLTSFYRK